MRSDERGLNRGFHVWIWIVATSAGKNIKLFDSPKERGKMKVKSKNSCFNRMISRVFVLGALLSILVGPWSALASPQNDELISCGEFIAMMANHQPENPLFPEDHSRLSKKELYLETVQNLSGKGFRVLEKKSFHDPLEANEFVQVSYAFAKGPLGKNLFEQKLFLKEAGIIDSADVGLTTAYDGKVYQTHWEENVVRPVRLATPVYMNDHFETDLSSKATFTFDDGSTLTLAEGSIVNITKHIYDPSKDLRQTIIHLSRGTVRFVVTKGKARGSMFKVITPTAIAGVRGTEFVVDVAPDGKTNFLVLEGQIETKSMLPGRDRAKTYYVSAGENQIVSKSGNAAQVKKASPALLRSVEKKTSKPKEIFKQRGLSKKIVRKKIQRLALAHKTGNGKKRKARIIKVKVLNKRMKAKVLKMANHAALFEAKALGKRFEKIRVENSSKFTLMNPEKANTRGNAKVNAKDNAKHNAKINARANAKRNAKVNARANVRANIRANARANARQVAQERAREKRIKRRGRNCFSKGRC
jgi:FecR protein